MPVCAVPTCATTHRTTDKTLYRFPKDVNYARIWVRCCMKRDSFNTKSAFICSSHFADEAYQRDINHDILGASSKKNLRKDAVPTLQLPSIRMFRKNVVETQKSEDLSLLVSVIPALSPKSFLKSIRFDFLSSPRMNKSRVKFHQPYRKYRSNSLSFEHSTDASFDVAAENADLNAECMSEKSENPTSMSKMEPESLDDSDKLMH